MSPSGLKDYRDRSIAVDRWTFLAGILMFAAAYLAVWAGLR